MEIESFVIFKNDKKVQGSNQPDYIINSKDTNGNFVKWGGGWIKEGKNGKFISCSKSKQKPQQEDNSDLDL